MDIQSAASALIRAETSKKTIEPFTSTETVSVDEAYKIQLEIIRRKREDGAVIVGKKIGLTSEAMQEMLQVNKPDYGHLLGDMIYDQESVISLNKFIQPKIEFEIAFVLNKDLQGPGVTVDDVRDATDYVIPAIEIIDSRVRDWQIQFEDTVADNGSSAGAVFGKGTRQLHDIDLPRTEMTVYKNGSFLDAATGAAVMGDPVKAVAWLANEVGNYGISLKTGETILAGALSKAVPFEAGDQFEAVFANLGTVKASF